MAGTAKAGTVMASSAKAGSAKAGSAKAGTVQAASPWPPRVLREHAFIADGERGALIGQDGAIVWLCAPGWDSPAVFAALLGGRGGYSVTPTEPWRVPGGHYEPGTLIWHSRWTGRSVTECHEALAMPADPHRAVLLRRVIATDGPARVRVLLDLRTAFGRTPVRDLSRTAGVWTGRAGAIRFRLTGAARARADAAGRLELTLPVAAGQHHDLILEVSDRPLPDAPPDPVQAWSGTRSAWSGVVPDCADLIAVRDTQHAYAILAGLTASTGAMVAAPTTSLPERLESGRNYDYRYAWIRDQCYAGLAVATRGPHPLLDGTVRFITERVLADGPKLMPAYTVGGKPIPGERPLRVPGYPGGRARSGNRVAAQFQLDALGEVLQLLAAAARLDRLDPDSWKAAQVAADAIGQCWMQPDAGLWELDDRHWTHSRLTCAAGLRSIAAAVSARPGALGSSQAGAWTSLADAIMASLADAVHPSGRWQRAPDDERVDAALLLPLIRDAADRSDPRTAATVRAVAAELSQDDFVYRFRHDARPLHEAEGAFLLCGFWMAQAAHASGDPVGAVRYFERNRSACGPAGLFAEEYDVHQRQLRGNLPQAFVHAGLLETAARLSADGVCGPAGGETGARA
jgi:alpha,alpha-trehalase